MLQLGLTLAGTLASLLNSYVSQWKCRRSYQIILRAKVDDGVRSFILFVPRKALFSNPSIHEGPWGRRAGSKIHGCPIFESSSLGVLYLFSIEQEFVLHFEGSLLGRQGQSTSAHWRGRIIPDSGGNVLTNTCIQSESRSPNCTLHKNKW